MSLFGITLHFIRCVLMIWEKSHFRLDFWRFSTCYYHSAVTLKNRTLPLKWLSYSFNITCSLNMWFSGNSDCKASSWNTGDLGLIPESRRSAGEGNGYPLHYSCLDNSLDRGAWWATVHGVTRVRHDWVANAHTQIILIGKQKTCPSENLYDMTTLW